MMSSSPPVCAAWLNLSVMDACAVKSYSAIFSIIQLLDHTGQRHELFTLPKIYTHQPEQGKVNNNSHLVTMQCKGPGIHLVAI